MSDIEKHQIKSSRDLEKTGELSPQASVENGDLKILHADPNDGDEALKAFAGLDEAIVMTPEQEKALLRKIDLNLMPVRVDLFSILTNSN